MLLVVGIEAFDSPNKAGLGVESCDPDCPNRFADVDGAVGVEVGLNKLFEVAAVEDGVKFNPEFAVFGSAGVDVPNRVVEFEL